MDLQPTKASNPAASSSGDSGNLHQQLPLPTISDVANITAQSLAEKTYIINEVFYSPQGEGVRAGTMNVFVRFTGCNLRCSTSETSDKSPGNFDCDTEFVSGRKLILDQLYKLIKEVSEDCPWLILTGGEPALQVDRQFCDYFHGLGYLLAIETNGSVELPSAEEMVFGSYHPTQFQKRYLLDWITVSPKVAEHCIRQKWASEVKYVRGYGQAIPKTVVEAEHYVISPAFDGTNLDKRTLQWCIQLCKDNPQWRLSCQQHKFWAVR